MDYLQIGDDYITVYNKEEFDKAVKDEFEEDKRKFEESKKLFEQKKRKLESDKTKLESDKTKLESDKTKFESEKMKFAKDLKINGIPVKKIIELTRLSEKQINML